MLIPNLSDLIPQDQPIDDAVIRYVVHQALEALPLSPLERHKAAEYVISRAENAGLTGALNGGPIWRPDPENQPQQLAMDSPADELFYGGSAGGG